MQLEKEAFSASQGKTGSSHSWAQNCDINFIKFLSHRQVGPGGQGVLPGIRQRHPQYQDFLQCTIF